MSYIEHVKLQIQKLLHDIQSNYMYLFEYFKHFRIAFIKKL